MFFFLLPPGLFYFPVVFALLEAAKALFLPQAIPNRWPGFEAESCGGMVAKLQATILEGSPQRVSKASELAMLGLN
jgi:hypothetical protein